MPSTLPKRVQERFKVKRLNWYLVDVTDVYKPHVIRKHFTNPVSAREFKDRNKERVLKVINWRDASKYDLKSRMNGISRKPKYDYPKECTTQYERFLYRKMIRKRVNYRRMISLTKTRTWEIIEDKPIKFVKRLTMYADNHWAYSDPVEGFNNFKEKYEWPDKVVTLSNIVRVLRKYYDVGYHPVYDVALIIYNIWGDRIKKHCNGTIAIPKNHEKVASELKARGFVEYSESGLDDDEHWVESISIKPRLVYPEAMWFSFDEKKYYDHYVYDMGAKLGIPGFTRCRVAKL